MNEVIRTQLEKYLLPTGFYDTRAIRESEGMDAHKARFLDIFGDDEDVKEDEKSELLQAAETFNVQKLIDDENTALEVNTVDAVSADETTAAINADASTSDSVSSDAVEGKTKYTFTITPNDLITEVEVEGIAFMVRFSNWESVHLEVFGGYAIDDEGEYWEVDGDYHIRTLLDDVDVTDGDQEFQITITQADLNKAREYRKHYPEDIEE